MKTSSLLAPVLISAASGIVLTLASVLLAHRASLNLVHVLVTAYVCSSLIAITLKSYASPASLTHLGARRLGAGC